MMMKLTTMMTMLMMMMMIMIRMIIDDYDFYYKGKPLHGKSAVQMEFAVRERGEGGGLKSYLAEFHLNSTFFSKQGLP